MTAPVITVSISRRAILVAAVLLAALSYGAYRAYRWWQGPSATALELASVRVVQIGRDGHELGWGSGAVIAPGLILTNGHVANPRDPGERLLWGPDE